MVSSWATRLWQSSKCIFISSSLRRLSWSHHCSLSSRQGNATANHILVSHLFSTKESLDHDRAGVKAYGHQTHSHLSLCYSRFLVSNPAVGPLRKRSPVTVPDARAHFRSKEALSSPKTQTPDSLQIRYWLNSILLAATLVPSLPHRQVLPRGRSRQYCLSATGRGRLAVMSPLAYGGVGAWLWLSFPVLWLQELYPSTFYYSQGDPLSWLCMLYVPCGSACMAWERVSRCPSRIATSAYDNDRRQNGVAAEPLQHVG